MVKRKLAFKEIKIYINLQTRLKISHRRLRFFGHVARLPDGASAKVALYKSTRDIKKPKGRPPTTLKSQHK